jgi:hypothetical protein
MTYILLMPDTTVTLPICSSICSIDFAAPYFAIKVDLHELISQALKNGRLGLLDSIQSSDQATIRWQPAKNALT